MVFPWHVPDEKKHTHDFYLVLSFRLNILFLLPLSSHPHATEGIVSITGVGSSSSQMVKA